MMRGVCLLLLLSFSWLVARPGLRLVAAPARAAVVASARGDACVAGPEHVAAQSATPQVEPAPLLGRVPATPPGTPGASSTPSCERPGCTRDLRAALRRVQLRRRVPRLGGADPPWA